MRLLAPDLERAEAGCDEAHDELRKAEETWQQLQGQWEALNLDISGIDRQMEVNTTHKELLISALPGLDQRRNNLENEAPQARSGGA